VVYRSVQLKKAVAGKEYTHRYDEFPHDTYSGTFTIEFSIYDPYGYLKYNTYENYDYDGAGMYCGMLEKDEMPEDPSVNTRDFLIYNPGTETCETLIRIGGSAGEDGVTITNNTNGSECKLLSLPSSGYLEIDSFHGTVVHVEGDNRTLDFEYHDEGYLTLASYGKRTDEVMATTQSGSATVT